MKQYRSKQNKRKTRTSGSKAAALPVSFLSLYEKLADFLYRRFLASGHRPKLENDLQGICLYKKDCAKDYYIRKITLTLLLASAIAVFLFLTLLVSSHRDRTVHSYRIPRPDYGEADLDEELELYVNGEKESENPVIHVSPKQYTSAEVSRILKDADSSLQKILLGENPSPDEVRYPLSLPETLQGGLVSADYLISPSGLIDEDTGEITGSPDESGTPVVIEAQLRFQNRERISRFSILLFPPVLDGRQAFQADLNAALKKADEEDPSSDSVRLPASAGDTVLVWYRPESPLLTLLIFLGILLPALYWIRQDEKIRQAAVIRKERLDLDYSELLFQLTLLLGAGLTIRGAFTRICAQTSEGERHNPARAVRTAASSPRFSAGFQPSSSSPRFSADFRPSSSSPRFSALFSPVPPASPHPVYEEIRCMLREISGGIPEETAYENFGRRCGLPPYIKLGSLLAQNLKKGSRGLTALLEKEAFLSLQQHRTAARKLGEKASMRMLLPMILMFVDVLIILMVPALLNM